MINKSTARIAIGVINKSIQMLNERNTTELLSTFHAPHIIIAESQTIIYKSKKDLENNYWDDFHRRAGEEWHHTVVDWTEPIHATQTKAHIFMQFSRYTVDDRLLTCERALWVVNRQNGVWAAQARSNFNTI